MKKISYLLIFALSSQLLSSNLGKRAHTEAELQKSTSKLANLSLENNENEIEITDTQTQEVKKITLPDEITFQVPDALNSSETENIKIKGVPLKILVKSSVTLQNLIGEAQEKELIIPLPNINNSSFKSLMIALLSDKQFTPENLERLYTHRKLNKSELVNVVNAINYLDINIPPLKASLLYLLSKKIKEWIDAHHFMSYEDRNYSIQQYMNYIGLDELSLSELNQIIFEPNFGENITKFKLNAEGHFSIRSYSSDGRFVGINGNEAWNKNLFILDNLNNVLTKYEGDLIKISPNGKYAIISQGSEIKIINIQAKKIIKNIDLQNNSYSLPSIDFSENSKYAVIKYKLYTSGTLYIVDLDELKVVQEYEYIKFEDFSSNGPYMYTLNNKDEASIINTNSFSTIKNFTNVKTMFFKPQSNSLVIVDLSGNSFQTYNIDTDQIDNFTTYANSKIEDLVFSPDGKYIAFNLNTNKVFLWNTESGSYLELPYTINNLKFSPDSSYILLYNTFENTAFVIYTDFSTEYEGTKINVPNLAGAMPLNNYLIFETITYGNNQENGISVFDIYNKKFIKNYKLPYKSMPILVGEKYIFYIDENNTICRLNLGI